jgi:AP-3 complex subunit beta
MKRIGDSQYFAQTPKLDLIQKQLDSDNTSHKLEALKRLIAMISKGKESVSMFPYVVKNIVSSSVEVKKLVYMYLIHYAEQKPDEALLSISHFQKDMTDKNQFIRASALRVLSSIRVPLIAQIVMIAIRKCANDGSPFVRKVAAIAIPKVYSLNEEERDALVGVIENLMGDNNTSVLGAAMFAFSEVCPERYDLLHKHYRKLCRLLVDCDEWGQSLICNCLLRYARTQFLSPFKEGYKKKTAFYNKKGASDSEGDSSDGEDPYVYDMDGDHRLLLKSTTPLLQSRNSAVVLSIASLYFHVAPVSEFGTVVKSLLRIARSSRESQFVILTNISSMAAERPGVFRPYFKDFFVSTVDASLIRELKLNILAMLATESNVPTILKEFRVYIKHDDKAFVKNTIGALGRVANNIPEVADACLTDLLGLINSKVEETAAEAVIIMRHLLQKQALNHPRIVKKLAKLLDTIQVPVARASIIWLVGEFHQLIPTLAPDCFRKLAKSFCEEADCAKLQIITLGVKLYLNEKQDAKVKARIAEIFQFVLLMAKYDVLYDIRDRTRMARTLLFTEDDTQAGKVLRQKVKDVLLCEKAPPEFDTKPQDQSRFQLSSMSHIVNHTASGYIALPDFPSAQPDMGLRDVDDRRHLYSDDEADTESESSESESDETSEEESERSDSDESDSDKSSSSDSEDSDNDSASGSSSGSDRGRSPPRQQQPEYPPVPTFSPAPQSAAPAPAEKPIDIMEFLATSENSAKPISSMAGSVEDAQRQPLLAPGAGKGLSIQYVVSGNPSTYPGMQLIKLWFQNQGSGEISQVHIGHEDLPDGADLIAFPPISSISPGATLPATMHVKPGTAASAPLKFEVWTSNDQFPVSLVLGKNLSL